MGYTFLNCTGHVGDPAHAEVLHGYVISLDRPLHEAMNREKGMHAKRRIAACRYANKRKLVNLLWSVDLVSRSASRARQAPITHTRPGHA